MQNQPTSYRVGDPGVRALFAEPARIQSWLDVEVALAQAQAELGVIPAYAAEEIAAKARCENLDMDNIREGLARTGHPLVPMIWELDRICEGDAGGYIHWGATTQNITQTGMLLNLRRAHRVFLAQLADLLSELARIADAAKDFALPGRTHGQHAVPATYGYKVSVWIDELCRHADRLRGCEDRVFAAMLGGGAGTLASLGETGLAIQDRMARLLEMRPMPNPSRAIADHLAEYITILALLAATCSKIGREVYTQMKQEFGEVEEPVPEGTVGSSTMPQKRNPKLAQDIVAGAAQIRALVPLALEAMQTEHEADRTTSVMMDKALNESCILTGDILQRMVSLFAGLRVFPDRMRQNLDLSGGLIMSEALMLELGKRIGRQQAHDIVYDAAQASFTDNIPFARALSQTPEIRAHLTDQQITALLDPAAYTGVSALLATRAAAQAREVAGALHAAARDANA